MVQAWLKARRNITGPDNSACRKRSSRLSLQGSLIGGVTVDKSITVRSVYREPDVKNSLSWLDPDNNELAGEASPGSVSLLNLHGQAANPGHAIFPIFKVVNKRVYLIGIGFFITDNGLFATANHVLMDAFDKDDCPKYGIGLFQFIEGNIYISRPILRFSAHPIADVAVGVAAPMQNNKTNQPLKDLYLSSGARAGLRPTELRGRRHIDVGRR
jgi:hypothetical protein